MSSIISKKTRAREAGPTAGGVAALCSMRGLVQKVAACAAILSSVAVGKAQTLYWDTNGDGAGNGTTTESLSGIWAARPNGNLRNWSVSSLGEQGVPPHVREWANSSNAVFAAGAQATGVTYVVTLETPIIAHSILVEEGTLTLVSDKAQDTLTMSGGSQTISNTASAGLLTINPSIVVPGGTILTVTPAAGGIRIGGEVSGTGSSLLKSGVGTLTLSGPTSFSGVTTVGGGILALTGAGSLAQTSAIDVHGGGTLLLGGSNRINDAAGLALGTLGGLGAVLNTGGFNEVLGALTLNASSTIDLGGGAGIVKFLGTGTNFALGKTLTITNWSGSANGGGTDQVLFTRDMTPFLSQISFDGEPARQIDRGLGVFEVVSAVPEPSTIVGAIGLVCLVGYRERRRLSGFLRSQRTEA